MHCASPERSIRQVQRRSTFHVPTSPYVTPLRICTQHSDSSSRKDNRTSLSRHLRTPSPSRLRCGMRRRLRHQTRRKSSAELVKPHHNDTGSSERRKCRFNCSWSPARPLAPIVPFGPPFQLFHHLRCLLLPSLFSFFVFGLLKLVFCSGHPGRPAFLQVARASWQSVAQQQQQQQQQRRRRRRRRRRGFGDEFITRVG